MNGRLSRRTRPRTVREDDLVRVRLIDISSLAYPMHPHGHDFTVVAKDGEPIRPEVRQPMNTLSVDAGATHVGYGALSSPRRCGTRGTQERSGR